MNSEQRFTTLEERLCRANRQLRVLAGVVLCLAAGFVWAFTTPADDPEKPGEVRASRFVLVDEDGKERAFMVANESGTILSFSDEQGRARAALVVQGRDAGLFLHDEDGAIRVSLTVMEEAGLVLHDASGAGRIALGLFDEEPTFLLRDRKGTPRVQLATHDDVPRLSLKDERGRRRAQVGGGTVVGLDGEDVVMDEATMLLFAPDGKVMRKLP